MLGSNSETYRPIFSIMMASFNRLELTMQTMESLRRTVKLPTELIVIDNGSTDDAAEWLQTQMDIIDVLVLNPENYGIARARNQSLYRATADYLVTIDNDVILPEGWLEALKDILDAIPSIGTVGLNYEARYPIENRNGIDVEIKPKYSNVGTATMMFRRSLHEQIGYFTEFALYGEEDADFGYRAGMLGLDNAYAVGITGKHIGTGKAELPDYLSFKRECRKGNIPLLGRYIKEYRSGQRPLKVDYAE